MLVVLALYFQSFKLMSVISRYSVSSILSAGKLTSTDKHFAPLASSSPLILGLLQNATYNLCWGKRKEETASRHSILYVLGPYCTACIKLLFGNKFVFGSSTSAGLRLAIIWMRSPLNRTRSNSSTKCLAALIPRARKWIRYNKIS
jgi:hypothetical protein